MNPAKFSFRFILPVALALIAMSLATDAQAQDKKPNILFIMGDDIGWMQPSCYHRGLMVGETPNIDRIANEGGIFMHYYAESELHRRAQRLLHRNASAAHGHDPAAVAGRHFLSAARHAGARQVPATIWATPPVSSARTTWAITPDSLPTAHGFQEFWGYLYHLDAMQQVSFPDINKTPTEQGVVPPCKNTPIPGLSDIPGRS